MRTEQNKALIAGIFAETAKGNGGPFVDALADDVEWRIIGSTSWSKTFVGRAAVVNDLLRPLRQQFIGSNTIVAERVLAEGDYVVVEARGRNRTRQGRDLLRERRVGRISLLWRSAGCPVIAAVIRCSDTVVTGRRSSCWPSAGTSPTG
jgi:ketosteroid isomerase-like protein